MNTAAFGQSAAPATGFTRAQRFVGLGFVGAVVAAIVTLAMISTPSSANRPELFGGSLVLENTLGEPVVVDLATGSLTTRFARLTEYVDTQDPTAQVVPMDTGTLLVSERGSINFLGLENYLVRKDAGVLLDDGLTAARGVAAGPRAYVVAGSSEGVVVAAVDRDSVATEKPLGLAKFDGTFTGRPGSYATAAGGVWIVDDDGALNEIEPETPSYLRTERGQLDPGAVLAAGGDRTAEGQPSALVAADAGTLYLFDATTDADPIELPSGVDGATRIVPTTGSESVVWFLYEGRDGWYVVGADTGTGERVGPELLDADFDAGPVVPAYAEGRLYTLDGRSATDPADTPTLLMLDPRSGLATPITGDDGEPVKYALKIAGERTSFTGTHVVARGPRVVFNNPLTAYAYVVFTDGSSAPTLIDKSDTRNTFDPTQSPGRIVAPEDETNAAEGGETTPTTAPPTAPDAQAASTEVDETIDCTREDQQPHAPLIVGRTPLPRSITIAWDYETVDTRDCIPSTFIVSITPVNGARSVDRPEREVNGVQEITFEGLRPNSTYELTVTARIGDNETASDPVQVTTLPTGPDKPTSVVVTADPVKGVWNVSWGDCGSDCDVPVAGWVVQGVELCGGGNNAALPVIDVAGSANSVIVPYGDLVGRSVRFQVYGRAADGLNGDATRAAQCVEGWREPQLDKIAFDAAPGDFLGNSKVEAVLSVTISGPPLHAFGATDVQLEYVVDGAVIAIHGLPTGTRDEATTEVRARRPHAGSLVIRSHGRTWTLGPDEFAQDLPWAPIQLTATHQAVPGNPNVGRVTATAAGVYDGTSGGPLVVTGNVQCGSAQAASFTDKAVTANGAAGTFTIDNIDLIHFGGRCRLRATFREPDPNEQVHEGPSPQVATDVNLGDPPRGGAVGTNPQAYWQGEQLWIEFAPTTAGGSEITMEIRSDVAGPHEPCTTTIVFTPGSFVSLDVNHLSCIELAKQEEHGEFEFRVTVTLTRTYLGVQLYSQFESPVILLQGIADDDTTTTTSP